MAKKGAKRAYSTGEIATYCGVNFRTVIRWIDRCDLKAFQLPGRGDNRVTRPNLLRFLRSNDMPIPADLEVKDRRVLIIDDSERYAKQMVKALTKSDFETEVANNAFSAGAFLQSFSPVVAVVEFKMPGLDGITVLESIRADPNLAEMKILSVSQVPRSELTAALSAGADDILKKPMKNLKLVEKVQRLAGLEAEAAT